MPNRLRQILLPLLIVVSILGLIHLLIFKTTVPDLTTSLHIPLAVLLTLGLASIPLGLVVSHGAWRKRLLPVTYFIAFSFVLVELVVSLFVTHSYSYWPLLATLLAGIWSIIHALRPPRIITHEMSGPGAMNGISLVQISDLHIGMPFLNETWLAKQVNRINDLKPDFVAITGDLADGPFEIVAPMLAPLANLKPLKKKYYVTGNHEFIRGGNWEKRLQELGFTVLHNTHEIFETAQGKFMIAGVPDRVIQSRGLESSPSKALDRLPYFTGT